MKTYNNYWLGGAMCYVLAVERSQVPQDHCGMASERGSRESDRNSDCSYVTMIIYSWRRI